MRAWVVDLGVAVVAFAGAAARVAAAPVLVGDRVPDLLAYSMVAGMALVLLARRRWPAVVLAVVVVLFLAYHVHRYPGGAPAVPVWIGLYSVAVAPRRKWGLAVAAVLIVIDAQSRMLVAGIGPLDAALDGSTGMFVASLLLGEAVRARREHLRLLAADRDRAAAQALTEERIRIARELHDLGAHTLAVVSVQAGVAEEVLDDDPGQAKEAIAVVRRAAREAMTELRAAAGVLRDGTRPLDGGVPEPTVPTSRPGATSVAPPELIPLLTTSEQGQRRPPEPDLRQPPEPSAMDLGRLPAPPAPSLSRLPELARATGAVLVEKGTRRGLSRAVEATAFRIVQEAVANAVRHSGATVIEIRIGYADDGLSLAVLDDGRGGRGTTGAGVPGAGVPGAGVPGAGTASDWVPGNGLRGMAERAVGLGGWVRAGRRSSGGFEVLGWLPA